MKPRKFLEKRSKPDGGGGESLAGLKVIDYYHIKSTKLKNLRSKKFSNSDRRKLKKEPESENNANNVKIVIGLIVSLVVFTALLIYVNIQFEWF